MDRRKVAAVYRHLADHPDQIILWVILSIITAIIVILLVKSEPQIKGSGIPQVEGKLSGEIDYNWFSVLWKKVYRGHFIRRIGSFGAGRSFDSTRCCCRTRFKSVLRSPKVRRKILISSGASAGLSAAFNAPIAGLLFILEEIHHSFSPLVWLTSFASVISANFVSLNFWIETCPLPRKDQ